MEELENIESGIFMIMGIHDLLEEFLPSKISNKYFCLLYWIMDIEYTQLSKVRFVVQCPVVDSKASPSPLFPQYLKIIHIKIQAILVQLCWKGFYRVRGQ